MFWLLLLRVMIAGVFAAAAAGKLADRSGTRTAVADFGAPAALIGAIAIALPVAELAVAGLLLFPATAVAGAAGALALLAVFSAAIAINLARGRRPDCHCFGQVHSEPIGAPTLLRNAALAGAAALVIGFGVSDPGGSAVAWAVSSPGVALGAGLAAGIVLAAAIAFVLMRRYGAALRRIDQLAVTLREEGLDVPEPDDEPTIPIGGRAPRFEGIDGLLAAGRPILLTFTSTGCGPCRELRPRLARWRDDHGDLVTVAELTYDDDTGLARSYGVEGTPAAVVVSPGGTVESRIAHGPEAIAGLWEETLLESLPPPPDVGEPVPDLPLETLDSEPARLLDSLDRDRDTLLLFWNPACGFCDAMRDDLRPLEGAPVNGHPSLLVVSGGDRDAARENGFRSRVLFDPASIASSSLGAGGTPTAVLVAPDGTVRSGVAGGREAVLTLAGMASAPALEVVLGGRAETEAEGSPTNGRVAANER